MRVTKSHNGLHYGEITKESAQLLAEHAGDILEVGAGNGVVAKALTDGGFDVIATDPGLEGYAQTVHVGTHHQVAKLTALEALEKYQERDILLVMPNPEDFWPVDFLPELKAGQRLFLCLDAESMTPVTESIRQRGNKHKILNTILSALGSGFELLGSAAINSPCEGGKLYAYERR